MAWQWIPLMHPSYKMISLHFQRHWLGYLTFGNVAGPQQLIRTLVHPALFPPARYFVLKSSRQPAECNWVHERCVMKPADCGKRTFVNKSFSLPLPVSAVRWWTVPHWSTAAQRPTSKGSMQMRPLHKTCSSTGKQKDETHFECKATSWSNCCQRQMENANHFQAFLKLCYYSSLYTVEYSISHITWGEGRLS